MRKSKLKIPGFEDVEFEEYSDPISPSEDPDKFLDRMRQERKHDASLDEVATKIAKVVEKAVREDRAILFWEVGMMLLQYRPKPGARRKDVPTFERIGQVLDRVNEKVADRLADTPVGHRSPYSVNYLRKLILFAKLSTREQAARPVVYSLQHELVTDELTPAERNAFLDRCENGEFGRSENMKLRRAVNRLLIEKALDGAHAPLESRATLLDRAMNGESLRQLRREIAAIGGSAGTPSMAR